MSQCLSLDDLRYEGPPVRLRDLCKLTGFSKMKFLDDIDRGKLAARPVKTGQTHVMLIEREEAYRYLADIGFSA